MTENYILIKSFDITEELIKQNPNDENKIINEFNNFIIKIKSKSNNKSFVRAATFGNSESDNPLDITIHNNFQRFNDANDSDYDYGNSNGNGNNNGNGNDNKRIGIKNDNLITSTRVETFENKNDNLFKEYFSFK
jgi:hypothetical protein